MIPRRRERLLPSSFFLLPSSFFLILVFHFLSPTEMQAQWVEVPDSVYVPDQLIVWFRPGVLNTDYLGCDEEYNPSDGLPLSSIFILDPNILGYLQQLGVQRIDRGMSYLNPCRDTLTVSRSGDTIPVPDFWNVLLIKFDPEQFSGNIPNLAVFMTMMFQGAVKFAEPNYTLIQGSKPDRRKQPLVYPNDPEFLQGNQRSLQSWNLYYGTDVETAWTRTKGNSSIVVGIVDDGITATSPTQTAIGHPDFGTAGEVLIGGASYGLSLGNYYEKATHGTAMAGIVAALTNNELYVAGISGGSGPSSGDNAKLVALKTMDFQIGGNVLNVADGLVAGARRFGQPNLTAWGCDLINTSLYTHVGTPSSVLLRAAAAFCYQNDVLISACMGNQSMPTSLSEPIDVQGLDEEWILAVGASSGRNRWSGGNYGAHTDILAPEKNYTTDAFQSGSNFFYDASEAEHTSSATAHATGIASLLLSYRKDLETSGTASVPSYLAPEDIVLLMAEETKERKIPGSSGYPHQKDVKFGYGIVNAEETLKRISTPFKLEHISIPHTATVSGSTTLTNIPIGFPVNTVGQKPVDALHDVRQYHVKVKVNYGTALSFPAIRRVWGRGMKTKGFPPIREITFQGATNPVTLFRGVHWCKVTWFDDTQCEVETYLYEVTPTGTNNWSWLDGITPNDVVFAVSVLHEPGVTSISSLDETAFLFKTTYPQPFSISRNGALNIELSNHTRQKISMQLFDVLGRSIPISKDEFPAGIREMSLQLQSRIPAGVYLLRGTSASKVQQQKIVVTP